MSDHLSLNLLKELRKKYKIPVSMQKLSKKKIAFFFKIASVNGNLSFNLKALFRQVNP